jgi:hypothetical protein
MDEQIAIETQINEIKKQLAEKSAIRLVPNHWHQIPKEYERQTFIYLDGQMPADVPQIYIIRSAYSR